MSSTHAQIQRQSTGGTASAGGEAADTACELDRKLHLRRRLSKERKTMS